MSLTLALFIIRLVVWFYPLGCVGWQDARKPPILCKVNHQLP